MSVKANILLGLTVTETVGTDAAGYANVNNSAVKFDGAKVDESLTGTTTPPVTAHGVGAVTMTAGAGTLDLRALTGLNGAAVDLNGLKPRAILFENPATNANPITIAKGASNGYTGLGSAFSITLQPGQKHLARLGAAGTAVSATVKTFDITGTGTQVLKYQTVAGV